MCGLLPERSTWKGSLLGGNRLQSLPCKGLRSRAPPAAEKARRSRYSGRRAQACFSARRAMRAPQTGRWLRRKAQTEGCIAGWRRKYPVKSGKTLPRVRRGRCLASSRKPCDAANPKRRAKSPALQGTRKRAAMRKRQLSARPADGPMQASAPTQRGDTPQLSSTCRACRPRLCRPYALHCRAGVHARRGGSRRPGGVLVRPCAAPLSRLAPPAPLPGEPFKRQSLYKASPARGGGCAARRRRRGALPPCPTGILQTLAGPCPASVGDDACIVPEAQRCRKAPRRAKSPALHCGREWAATHKHQPSVGPADGPMQASAPTQGGLR